jgi:hypothetical protein
MTASVGAGTSDSEGTSQSAFDSTVGHGTYDVGSASVNVRAGRRKYVLLTQQATRFASVGLLGGVLRSRRESKSQNFLDDTRSSSWNAGVFGELGAAYLIVPNVSLGVIGSVEGRFTRTLGTSTYMEQGVAYSQSSKANSYSVSTEILSAVLTVYF